MNLTHKFVAWVDRGRGEKEEREKRERMEVRKESKCVKCMPDTLILFFSFLPSFFLIRLLPKLTNTGSYIYNNQYIHRSRMDDMWGKEGKNERERKTLEWPAASVEEEGKGHFLVDQRSSIKEISLLWISLWREECESEMKSDFYRERKKNESVFDSCTEWIPLWLLSSLFSSVSHTFSVDVSLSLSLSFTK